MNRFQFFLSVFCLLAVQSLVGQSVSIGLNAGLRGVGADLGIGLGERIGIRGGYNFFKLEFNDREFKIPGSKDKTVPSSGTVDLSSFDVLGEFAAVSWLRLVGGINLASSKNLADLELTVAGGQVDMFGHSVTAPAGESVVSLKIEEATKIHPYLGLSLGRLVPNKIIGISGDLGFMVYKTPDVVEVESALSGDADRMAVQQKFGEQWREVYPVVSLRVAFRISGLED